ncbi:MAG TPA: capsule assembly Wzi family protein [Steroidobacter sp.]|uniref:capsule assembly Wzi family protein n=1 Tax=Steroidobacter sp. TaxID=1978227 RepID=UPI002EDA034C
MSSSRIFEVTLAVAAGLLSNAAMARGPTPYLPLNLSPEIERQIDQVLLLAGRPIVRRPIPAATVLDALGDACRIDQLLCERVSAYLSPYKGAHGLTHVGIEGGATRNSDRTLPNRRGMNAEAEWSASVAGQFRLHDYVQLQVGGVAYPGETIPAGSWLSVGNEYLQLDIGYRDHWWSPFTDSAMLIGTQAPTMPGITLSNYSPVTRFNLTYEAFIARMAHVDDIAFQDRTTSGKPRLAGLNLAIEPVPGWSLGASRVLQFGGGERKRSFSDLLNAFFRPTRFDNISEDLSTDDQFGNQVAALTSKFVFPTRQPFSVYFEYAGEDGSRAEGWRLGNVSLSAGIDIPRLWNRFDFTYEVSDWQNGWYVSGVYPDGTSNDGHVIGHWGADERIARDAIGAQSHMLRVGWAAPFGGLFDLRYRTLQNESYGVDRYEREHDFAVRYSRAWNEFVYGAEVNVGRDVFGEDFRRLAAFVRYSPGARHEFAGPVDPLPEQATRNVDLFVDAGVNASRLEFDPSDGGITPMEKTSAVGPHIGVGVRRAVNSRSALGVRVEMDDIDGMTALGVRAIDYRYNLSRRFAVGAFAGAMRLGAPTAAYGYYGGVSIQLRDAMPRFDLTLDIRGTDKIARDVLLPSDPANNTWGDVLYQVYSANLYVSYRLK